MSDMSDLFKTPLSNSSSPSRLHLSAASLAPTLSAQSFRYTSREEWRLSELEASLRKGVRREVGAESMQDELKLYFSIQKSVLTKRMLVFAGTIFLIFLTSSISASVLFTLLLLITTEVITSLVLPFCEPTLNANIRRLQPIIYCTIFYSLLKWVMGASTQHIDWPMTFIAIVGTIFRGVVTFYDSFFVLSTRSIIAEGIRLKKTLGKLMLFPKYIIYRGRMLVGIAKHLVITVTLLSSGVALFFYYFNKFSIDYFQPNCILVAVPIFLSLQLFMDFIVFINLTFTSDIGNSKLIKDKMPLFLTLLRLEYTPANRLVQLDCLKSLSIKVCQVDSFLTTETYKSLIYNTYMDVFNQYATVQLQRSNAALLAFVLKAKLNDKAMTQQKSPLQDLLVYFRKGISLVSSEWEASKMMGLLASLSILLLIIEKVQGVEEQVRVSGRVISLVQGIKDRLSECIERISLCNYTRGELMSFYNSFSRQEFFIKNS